MIIGKQVDSRTIEMDIDDEQSIDTGVLTNGRRKEGKQKRERDRGKRETREGGKEKRGRESEKEQCCPSDVKEDFL